MDAETALRDLRDYFREVAALRQRQMDGAITIQAAFAMESERGAYAHAHDMVQSYIDTLGKDDSRGAMARAVDTMSPN
jgi:hypothetical protein